MRYDDYRQGRLIAVSLLRDPTSVRCPKCGATPGKTCHGPSGVDGVRTHRERHVANVAARDAGYPEETR